MSKFSIALLVSVLTSWWSPAPKPSGKEAEVPTAIVAEAAIAPAVYPDVLMDDGDTSKVKSNPNNRQGDPTQQEYVTPLYLGNPSNYQTSFELSEDGTGYNIYERVGNTDVRRPSFISFEDYVRYRRESGMRDYFRQKAMANNEEDQRGLELAVNIDELTDIFGGGTVSIKPTGFATLSFSVDHNKTNNPALPQRQQSITIFNFDQQIQLGVIGQIGEKLRLNANFDTQATFDFENELKLEHSGTEDQILQKIEAGNVSMQLGNSLIQGRQNLFGLKTQLRFGPVDVTGIASIERGKVETVNVSGGGAIETPFDKPAAEYDMNRHFFLAHYFRSKYEGSLANLPVIQSNIRLNRVEIWVEQQGATNNTRNAVGFLDLGENEQSVANGQGVVYNDNLTTNANVAYPDNRANELYSLATGTAAIRQQSTAKGAIEGLPGLDMADTEDFQVLGNMRRLNQNEYTVNTQLGYISLNSPIPTDQVLFVAFNYTINGQTYQVGEFSDDVPADGLNSNVLFLKMLKSSVLRVNTGNNPYPAWDLMMKNIYNIGYGIQPDGFFLDVQYESGTSAGEINFLPTGPVANRPLIQVLGLDRLTNNTAPGPDNYFDYVEGITINSDRGLVIFPVLEPFGSHLADRLENDPDEVAKYVFQPLYDDTQQGAVQRYPELNRFRLTGFYQSAGGAEIPLNTFNLAEGSVTVTAGGRQLTEGTDFTVDYFGGKVTIINQSILASGQDISVSFESSALYQVQTKTLLGARAEYSPSQSLRLGATIMNLREQPFNLKNTLGEEPLNNTLWGLDASFRQESDALTKAIDKLPLITTKAPSNINASGEFAQFIPGQTNVLRGDRDGEAGVVFLDDFEAAAQPFSLQGQQRWKLASFPEGNPDLFDPRTAYNDPLASGFTRAKLAWYQIDQAFYQRFGIEFPEADLSNNYTRQVRPFELFPTATRAFGNNLQITFDLHYIPSRRGQYNFQADPNELEATGEFSNPEKNWAGIMRQIDINNDFEATNVEFLEFWMMDPYMDDPNHGGGKLYFNLGLVNEDVLTDETLSRENGLPGPNDPNPAGNLQETAWGRIPIGNPPVNAFSNDPADRTAQDIGYDGLDSEAEVTYFQAVTDQLANVLNPTALADFQADPSSDDFRHFRDDLYEASQAGILDRYLQFNGLEGNSPVGQDAREYTVQATQQPDNEDLNDNGSLNFAEQYWEYEIDLSPNALVPGTNFIVDSIRSTVPTDANANNQVTWYQFRIPLRAGRPVNDIQNFKTISYVRMYLAGFEEEVIARMTEFQLVSTQWLRYTGTLSDPGVIVNPPEPPFANFELGSVSREENSQKLPFNYVLPPGVEQQAVNGNTQAGFLQNERSLQLKVCGLEPGDARGIFKNVNFDMRQYKRLRMWVHAEPTDDGLTPPNFEDKGDATVFIRFGLDNEQNYYEYEIPLTPSVPGNVGDAENVWLAENEFDFELNLLALAKADRNTAGTGLIYRHSYQDADMQEKGHRIYVKGTPKLSDVRNVMIGIRNPRPGGEETVCLEVWVNELRMTSFDKENGYAANLNMSVNLADVGQINASGSYRSANFGPLEQRLSTRPQEELKRYDLSANLALDKFMPKAWGLQLPVYATYGEQVINPLFNPQEADVSTEQLIEQLPEEEAREKLREIQDYRRTRSIAFNNWRVMRNGGGAGPGAGPGRPGTTGRPGQPARPGRPGQGGQQGGGGKPPMPWDISNFDFSYAYNEEFRRSATIERIFNTQHRFGINYRYTFPQVTVEPFKNVKAFEKIALLRDFNFNPMPTSFSFSLAGNRQFEERLMRTTSQFGGNTDPFYSQNFLINRNYNLTWNLARNLQLTYNANNVGRVDEVQGYYETASERERDSLGTVWDNLFTFGRDPRTGNFLFLGRTINYDHNFNVAYQVPFNKIAPLDWLNSNVTYGGSFNWQQAPEVNRNLGATIANSQNIQANGRADINALLRKIPPVRKLLNEQRQVTPQVRESKQPPQGAVQKSGEQIIVFERDTTQSVDAFKAVKSFGKALLEVALGIRSIDVTYSENNSTILPGYLPKTAFFGADYGFIDTFTNTPSPLAPPTFGFLSGSQRDIRPLAGENNWISRDPTLANLFMQNSQSNLTGRTSLEIFKGFRIDLSINKNESRNFSSFYRWDTTFNDYQNFDPLLNGTYSVSYIFWNSAFEKNEDQSEAFQRFSSYRQIISRRLAEANPYYEDAANERELLTGGFFNGYTGTNQDVLIPAMLAAYGPYKPERIKLTSYPKIPLPNWTINYNGLSNLPIFKNIFQNITLKHAYRGTYTVGNFQNNLNAFDPLGLGYSFAADTVGTDTFGVIQNFYAVENIQLVQFSEQFAPLFGVNMNFKNGITAQVDYKMGRQMTFNVGNLQLTELRNQDFALMIGYRKDKLNLNFNFAGREIRLNNSLNVQVRATVRDTRERNRIMGATGTNQDPTLSADYTRGTYNFIFSPAIDYVVNQRLNVRIFFERNVNNPYVANAFDTSFTSGGVQLKFTLAN